MEDKNKEQKNDELQLLMKGKLEEDLVRMITKINEVNEVCSNLGRYTYMYSPAIETEVNQEGKQVPKVVCHAFPDREKDFHNTLTEDQFEDKYFMIKEKWENFQYDLEAKSMGQLAPEINVDEDEANVFGLNVAHEWKSIGQVYLFCDALSSMLETVNDEAPILDTKGEQKGTLTYSLIPSMYDDDGQEVGLLEFEEVSQLIGRTLYCKFQLHEARGLPENLCSEVYCEYKWIDERAQKFETERTQPFQKHKNPKWQYKATHDLYLSNYIVNNLAESTIVINIFGRLPHENMKGIIEDFSKRPETAALVGEEFQKQNVDEPFFKESEGDANAQVFRIDEAPEDEDSQGESPSIRLDEPPSARSDGKKTAATRSKKSTGREDYELKSDMMSETTKEKERQLELENQAMKKQLQEMENKMLEMQKDKLSSRKDAEQSKKSNCCTIF